MFVNLFAAGRARIRLQGGELALRQATGYPWDGRVRIQIAARARRPLTLRIRVPGWAKGHPLPTDLYRYAEVVAPPVTILLNGQLTPVIEEKGYAVLHRAWRPGDAVELNLPMPVRRVLARGDVKDNAGAASLSSAGR